MNSIHDDVSSSIFMTSFIQIFLILLLFISLIFSLNELIFFSLVLILTALISYIWTCFSLYRIKLDLMTESRSLFIGETLKIKIKTKNNKILPVLIKAGLFIENLVIRTEGVRQSAEEEYLFWFQEKIFSFEFSPEKRGVYFIHTPEIRTGDLSGFNSRAFNGKGGLEVSVYPRIHEIINLKIKKKEYSGTRKGLNAVPDHLLIKGVREYFGGNNIRDIHWQATAKYSMLMEKVFDSARKEKVLVILDVNNYKDKDFELSIEAAASALVKLNHSGIPSGFLTNGNIYKERMRYLPVSGSRSELMLILETLSGIESGDSLEMKDLLKKGSFLTNGISCLYFASSFSPQLDDVRFFLRKKGIPSLYVLAEEVSDSDILNIDDFIINKDSSI